MRRGQRRSDFGDHINAQRRAAQYVRMSTEHQKYSIDNQAAAIAQYAAALGLSIVTTYEDAAKSGLRIEGRRGLQKLITDVTSGHTDFDNILVYDVSRWGRFQDVDESAYYEFICKNAGIKVHYCAEQFENDGSLTSSVLKSIKRAMAGEYSRELSVKVFVSQCRISSLGFKVGSIAGYGLRRQSVDQNGKRKEQLRLGDRKGFQLDRVILIPGPKQEVETVQRIYHLFLHDDLKEGAIASRLNKDGILTEEGRAWTTSKVHGVLTKEKYIGNQVYNRMSRKLGGAPISNPPEMWVRCVGAFEPIVNVELFEAARQKISSRRCNMTDSGMIERLKTLLQAHGALSARLVKAAKNTPSPNAYRHRFGTLIRAWELAGYKPTLSFDYLPTRHHFRMVVARVVENITRDIELLGGTASFDRSNTLLTVNHELSVAIQPTYCKNYRRKEGRWLVRPRARPTADITIAVRMNESNTDVLDYLLLPGMDIRERRLWLQKENCPRIDNYCFSTLKPLLELCSRRSLPRSAPPI